MADAFPCPMLETILSPPLKKAKKSNHGEVHTAGWLNSQSAVQIKKKEQYVGITEVEITVGALNKQGMLLHMVNEMTNCLPLATWNFW